MYLLFSFEHLLLYRVVGRRSSGGGVKYPLIGGEAKGTQVEAYDMILFLDPHTHIGVIHLQVA